MSSQGKAIFSYQSKEVDELTVLKDDIVELLYLNEDNYWFAKLDGLYGLIPSNYVTKLSHDVEILSQTSDNQDLKLIASQRLQTDAKIESIR